MVEISLHEKDAGLLYQIRSRLQDRGSVYVQPQYERAKLYIRCKPFYEWLLSIGITPAKSESLNMDFSLFTNEDIVHFLRGYIDGDGSIQKISEHHARLLIVGNEAMMKKFQNIIFEISGVICSVFKIKTSAKFQMYKLALQRHDDVVNILHILYDNSTISLFRKNLIASSIMCRPVE